MPTFDWMHAAAAIAGLLASSVLPRLAGLPAKPLVPGAAPTGNHPLFETLVQVLEGKLKDIISIEPGPNGEPIFTLRVILVNDVPKKG